MQSVNSSGQDPSLLSVFVRFSMRGWLAGRMTFKEIKQVYVLLSSDNKDSTFLVFYWLTYGRKY